MSTKNRSTKSPKSKTDVPRNGKIETRLVFPVVPCKDYESHFCEEIKEAVRELKYPPLWDIQVIKWRFADSPDPLYWFDDFKAIHPNTEIVVQWQAWISEQEFADAHGLEV